MISGVQRVLSRIGEIQSIIGSLDPESAVPAAAATTRTIGGGVAAVGATTGADAAQAGTQRGEINRLISQAATRYGVSERLIQAVVKAESDYNPRCVSSAGAMGLMQLMPENCTDYGVSDPYDMAQNIDAGVRQLKQLSDKYGRLDLTLAAYNAGPGAVQRYGGIPPYRETQAYVRKILGWLSE